MHLTSDWVNGPRYLPLVNFLLTISLNIRLCSLMERLFGGTKVCDRCGILAWKPKCRPLYILRYWGVRLAVDSHFCQASGL